MLLKMFDILLFMGAGAGAGEKTGFGASQNRTGSATLIRTRII